MPGYTHLQRAQPILVAHHLLSYFQMLTRDRGRLVSLTARLGDMPLGSGALAGTGLPIRPEIVARELGFPSLSPNSLDAVASRDLVLEFLSFGAILLVHLSRLAEDLVLWTSSEFSFASLPDCLTTSSSMMPQKKNPDGAELMRAKSGRGIGNLVALLAVVKGLPMSYNRDLQEDKEPMLDTARTLEEVLPLAAAMIGQLEFDYARLLEAASDPMAAATDLADSLVRAGLPFRAAHRRVGALVAYAAGAGRSLTELSPGELAQHCPEADPRILESLSLGRILACRDTSPGGTAPLAVKRQLEAALALLEQEKRP
jgi:argininosuccinate lyase